MDPIQIIAEFYERHARAFEILVAHGEQVADKAIKAAGKIPHLQPDLNFIKNAAMLHDIGILHTDSPGFDCHGKHPYICHGFLGREMLESSGFPEYGPICERHIGVGISRDDIRNFNLPLPERDMLPVSIEEQIICYADKFFSKNGDGQKQNGEKPVEQILQELQLYGSKKVKIFRTWVQMF
ncbi:MAG: HDIG domain-containing protein [bacterium]|nr:HDIG domain-containing protein [bacterium]